MPTAAEHSSHRFALRPLAIAAAAALAFSAALPAQAQSFTQSGANSTSPVNLLPFNEALNPTSLDFGTNTIFIANGAPGSFSALAGAQLTAGTLSIANGGVAGSVGDVIFDGISAATATRTTVLLGGTANRLEVGNWGNGTLTVSGGALLDATVNAAACSAPGASCFNYIGNGAGSTATLNVTGGGSEVRALRGFTVGAPAVFTQAVDGFTFGTPGGTTNAFVNVLAGGKLSTQQATVGTGPNNTASLGTEKGFGTVVVDGPGSQWVVTPNSVDNSAAGMTIGNRVGGDGKVTVTNGGKLRIDGTGGPGPNDFLNIASNGGKGALTVSGLGSSVDVVGINTVLQVGRSGAGAQGSFSVLAGATASALYVNVGRDGAGGTMLIDGVGSKLSQVGVGVNQVAGLNGPAYTYIGRDGGQGQVTVSGGGEWLMSQGVGGDGTVSGNGLGIGLGRGANSSGTLLITGAGSKVVITSTSMNPGVGLGDNTNPSVDVGYDSPGTSSGTLRVENGGKLVMTGNAVSTQANGRNTSLNIGGRPGTAATGTATVTGAGSEIIVQGNDALINVGREAGSNGTLNVFAGGKVSSTSLAVGISAVGTVNIDNAWIALSGTRTDSNPLVGAGTTIGRGAGGNGALNMINGARLTIDPTVNTSGMAVGGDQFLAGGTGTVTMSGGSSIVFGGPLSGNGFSAGRTGTGNVNLSGGSFIDVGASGTVDFGRSPGGVGNLSLASGSKFMAGVIDFGGNSDAVLGGSGTATVSGLGSELKASGASGSILVGRGGTGVLAVTNQGQATGTILTIGRSGGTGSLTVSNGTVELSGQQTTGNLSGARFNVGIGGGTGVASITNGSTVNVTNLGSDGAAVNIGGSGNFPLGTGTLSMTGASQLNVTAATGAQANVHIGRDGNGTASLSGGSSINVGAGNLYVARETGSTGTLVMSSGSVINAGFVGVGVSQAGTTSTTLGTPGGTGTLVLNDSTINTTRFELGANGLLTGNNGVINAGLNGPVIIGGTVSPGNSPGRLRFNCDVTTLAGSQLILDVDGIGNGNYAFDELIIDSDSKFNLQKLNIVFNFIGDTNPETAFSQAGGNLTLDSFLRAGVGAGNQAFSSVFGSDWNALVNSSLITAVSSTYDITEFKLDTTSASGSFSVAALPVPEPATWGMMLFGLLALGGYAHWRQRANGQA